MKYSTQFEDFYESNYRKFEKASDKHVENLEDVAQSYIMRRLQDRNSCMDTDLTEVTWYLMSPIGILHQGDPLVCCKSNTVEFPTICRMARDILCIPTSSVSVERLFSSARDIIPYRRNRLGAPMIQDLLIRKSLQKRRKGNKASERQDCDELDHQIEVDLENIVGIVQAHALDAEFLRCII